jgi:hypothetical protein
MQLTGMSILIAMRDANERLGGLADEFMDDYANRKRLPDWRPLKVRLTDPYNQLALMQVIIERERKRL